MSQFSKVAWKEGLFLQPQHFQQADRYLEKLVQDRTGVITPYPWGMIEMQIDRDVIQHGRFGLRSAVGLMPDGTPFDTPNASSLPTPIMVPDDAAGQTVWLILPDASQNGQDVGGAGGSSAGTRYAVAAETVADNASSSRIEQTIEIAEPRLELALRKTPKPGYQCIPLARITEVRDGVVSIDDTVPPTGLVLTVHPAYEGYLTRVIGWIEAKLESLSRFASDPSSGGGLQASDYLMLMVLNRELPVLKHLHASGKVHPERLFEKLIGLAGELATFDQNERRVPDYGPYDHDNPREVFTPVVQDIQALLARDVGRAIRLPLKEVREGSFAAIVNDRSLFSQATFVIEVSSSLPLTQVQQQFPQLCKVGPTTQMKQIINNNLPGVPLVHLPNPPRQIRVVARNVYFLVDKSSDLWREFSVAPAIGMHFAGNWPDLKLELWAIPEQ